MTKLIVALVLALLVGAGAVAVFTPHHQSPPVLAANCQTSDC
jgi:hypothetical protein